MKRVNEVIWPIANLKHWPIRILITLDHSPILDKQGKELNHVAFVCFANQLKNLNCTSGMLTNQNVSVCINDLMCVYNAEHILVCHQRNDNVSFV